MWVFSTFFTFHNLHPIEQIDPLIQIRKLLCEYFALLETDRLIMKENEKKSSLISFSYEQYCVDAAVHFAIVLRCESSV